MTVYDIIMGARVRALLLAVRGDLSEEIFTDLHVISRERNYDNQGRRVEGTSYPWHLNQRNQNVPPVKAHIPVHVLFLLLYHTKSLFSLPTYFVGYPPRGLMHRQTSFCVMEAVRKSDFVREKKEVLRKNFKKLPLTMASSSIMFNDMKFSSSLRSRTTAVEENDLPNVKAKENCAHRAMFDGRLTTPVICQPRRSDHADRINHAATHHAATQATTENSSCPVKGPGNLSKTQDAVSPYRKAPSPG
ncbi:hypothetical protein ARMGADRAFT_1028309 [Armillaria gallica]|uniref:Uncharacterized protein n=1 Tax=Armillaria gallica TaxID=47427 RepID=A0A2H3E8X7_ARMGA|nr:hypothetical protein ARMGADRAFT_1028309 [Armillaria gallica]